MRQSAFPHKSVYFASLLLHAASLPLSIFATSVAEIALVANWLLEGKFREKFQGVRKRWALWLIISLYGLHLAGLLFTSNFGFAFHDLKIKLPILVLPLVFATSESLKHKNLRTILLVFCSAVLVSTFISFLIFLRIIPHEYYDIREISVFVSHIRLALMVNLSVFVLMWFSLPVSGEFALPVRWRVVTIPLIFWLIFFLVLLKSITGIFIFISLSLVFAWILAGRTKDIAPRFIIRVLLLVVPLIIASYISKSIGRFNYREPLDPAKLEAFTARGNPYNHMPELHYAENGHYVWIYLAESELEECWNKRSHIPYNGMDHKGQEIRYTIIRYMTSLGLRKDCDGMNALSDHDIRAIEDGLANHIFLDRYSLYPRIYEIIWEIDGYRKGGNPSGHSVAQRIYYLRAAKKIILEYPLFGVGTGDVQAAFDEVYSNGSELHEKYRRRAHNQYVTFLLTFGIVGTIWAMLTLFLPVFLESVNIFVKKKVILLFLCNNNKLVFTMNQLLS